MRNTNFVAAAWRSLNLLKFFVGSILSWNIYWLTPLYYSAYLTKYSSETGMKLTGVHKVRI
jgi:hypothetical protein